jgi:hypothetical protein
MLKDLDEPELEPESGSDGCEADGCQTDGCERGQPVAHFRASLWLGIAADIRRERLSREMKGQVLC